MSTTPNKLLKSSLQKEQDHDGGAPKKVVIQDECGDSLWNEVLEQEAAPLETNIENKEMPATGYNLHHQSIKSI